MASHELVQKSSALSALELADGSGGVPDPIRRRTADFFSEVVKLREQLQTTLKEYACVAGAVQVCADAIEDYDRATRLEEHVGVRLIFDLLVDMSYQIVEATGWEPQAVGPAVALCPRQAWPATAWPLPDDDSR